MLDYEFFYSVCEYGNKHWGGNFTPRETAYNAFDYLLDMKASVTAKKPTLAISTLLSLLDEDNTEEAKYFAKEIREGIR